MIFVLFHASSSLKSLGKGIIATNSEFSSQSHSLKIPVQTAESMTSAFMLPKILLSFLHSCSPKHFNANAGNQRSEVTVLHNIYQFVGNG